MVTSEDRLRRQQARLALVAVAGLWGLTFLLTKVGMAQLSPSAFVAGRFAMAALAASGWLAASWLRAGCCPPGWRVGIGLGLINLAVQLMQALSLVGLSASRAALLAGCHLLFVPGMQALGGLGRPGRADLVACSVCLTGLILVAGDTTGALGAAEAWAVGAELAFAAYVIVAASAAARQAAPVVMCTAALWVTAVGAAVLAGPALADLGHMARPTWLALGACGLGCTLLPTWLQLRFGPRLPPSQVALLLSLEPPLAAVCASLYLGERLGLAAWAGAALMLVAAAAPGWGAAGAVAASSAARKGSSRTGLSK